MSLTREECKNKLNNLKKLQTEIDNSCFLNSVANSVFIGSIECFEQLINEHFELVEKYDKLKRENLGLKQTIKNLREKEAKRYNDIMGSKFI